MKRLTALAILVMSKAAFGASITVTNILVLRSICGLTTLEEMSDKNLTLACKLFVRNRSIAALTKHLRLLESEAEQLKKENAKLQEELTRARTEPLAEAADRETTVFVVAYNALFRESSQEAGHWVVHCPKCLERVDSLPIGGRGRYTCHNCDWVSQFTESEIPTIKRLLFSKGARFKRGLLA